MKSLKLPKIKKILLYEMKFLVPNYSCLQNPWLGGYRPQIPVLSVRCLQLNLLNPPHPPNKIPGYANVLAWVLVVLVLAYSFRFQSGAHSCTLRRDHKVTTFVYNRGLAALIFLRKRGCFKRHVWIPVEHNVQSLPSIDLDSKLTERGVGCVAAVHWDRSIHDSRVISLADIPIIIIKVALVDCSDTNDLETWRLRSGAQSSHHRNWHLVFA